MAGFIRSVMSGLAVTAIFNGIVRMASPAPAPPVMPMMPPPQPLTEDTDNDIPFHERRVFGTPGAALYTAHNLGEDARRAGVQGETRVARELERLAKQYPNTYVFHSVKLPGKLGDIDHLVVQGSRMLLVDSKNWKHDATYHIYHSTFEADYVSRDGVEFAGGEIHLTRQIAEWQIEFMDSPVDVHGVLVIANRQSLVSESINSPYTFANIDGLAVTFQNLFSAETAVPPMHPMLLNRILPMVQQVHTPSFTPQPIPVGGQYYPVRQVKKPSTTATKWFVAWSIFNYTVMMILFPLAGLSAIPLLIAAHRHKTYVKEKGLGGQGLLTTVLVFTYILFAGWTLTMFMVLMYYSQRGLIF